MRAVVVLLSVAAGAGSAALQLLTGLPPTQHEPRINLLAADLDSDVSTTTGTGGPTASSGPLLIPTPSRSARDEARQLEMAEQVRKDRIAREEAERQRRAREAAEEKARHRVVAPVQGTITSNYGPRWGTTHYGLDIANVIGTPIVAPMRGVVLDAGPASGFGLWVRIQHEDGTITVYGHINSYAVSVGQEVEAGEVIAEVGNKGYSTGPHLHFEVWDPAGLKVDPLAWLQERGANVG
ncbi:M23 family metallopeptidase [Prauserella muralis]|uniref:M23ase beta-sheet core domain-containing protein n=1 Tax=Prauserella muralis TaxID=588067 RepID=A0A2V4B4G1_9PSEU|nr:peptidoglycan DD-metalloendopeptidase family protein [Prauserella muralis]PXY28268.1 hypothetical protein BAY60_18315 [Prauserella muralis]TWE27444.1 murein DD-endopeptidase MepM/ murein hydrolase activator NlpD [Prauserella muralis]